MDVIPDIVCVNTFMTVPERHGIRGVILAGGRDFGRCPIASRVPTALWPVPAMPAIEKLLGHLKAEGIGRIVVCCNGDNSCFRDALTGFGSQGVEFLTEELPVGTAGCIRDTACSHDDEILLVFAASMVCPPSVDTLIKAHIGGGAEMTVMFNPPDGNGRKLGTPAGIYVCSRSVLEHIPSEGYFDIKEGLIPEMVRAGRHIQAASLPNHAGNFNERQEYLHALGSYLHKAQTIDDGLPAGKRLDSAVLWQGTGVQIERDVKMYGPIVLNDGAHIGERTVIFGPAVIGRDVRVGKDSLVAESVLWDGAAVGRNCEIQHSVVDYDAAIADDFIVRDEAVAFKPEGLMKSLTRRFRVQKAAEKGQAGRGLALLGLQQQQLMPWFGAAVMLLVFLGSYWPGLVDLWRLLTRSDEYSSGLLVPMLAVYVLWVRRQEFTGWPSKTCLWGVPVLIAAQGVRLFGLYYMYSSAERFSIVLSIAALVLLLLGRQVFRKVWGILLFLCLMLPWPNRIQTALTLPLQQWATSSAVFCLELLGYEVIQDGNIINIGKCSVGVAEACNGLRMVVAFFVISGLVVLLIKRAWWEKLIIIVSSLPIALLCNTLRLAITAIAFTVLSGEYWEKLFHDFGGYAMMPLALGMVIGELWFLKKLTIVPAEQEAVVITRHNKTVNVTNSRREN